jgi:hypothetical protein
VYPDPPPLRLQGRPAGRGDPGVEERQRAAFAWLEAAGVIPETARAAARLSVAVTRGLLLDVLATGEDDAADAAMRLFLDLLLGGARVRVRDDPEAPDGTSGCAPG